MPTNQKIAGILIFNEHISKYHSRGGSSLISVFFVAVNHYFGTQTYWYYQYYHKLCNYENLFFYIPFFILKNLSVVLLQDTLPLNVIKFCLKKKCTIVPTMWKCLGWTNPKKQEFVNPLATLFSFLEYLWSFPIDWEVISHSFLFPSSFI